MSGGGTQTATRLGALARHAMPLVSTPLDGYTIMSASLLHELVFTLDWRGETHHRFDALRSKLEEHVAARFPSPASQPTVSVHVALRELARKFDGYCGKLAAAPPLVLPPQMNVQTRDPVALRAAMLCRTDECGARCKSGLEACTAATADVAVPEAWTRAMLLAYNLPPKPLEEPQSRALACVVGLHLP